jgi:predicted RNA-binding Zn-ribbon protein involved in translation (DUF1610 family)
VREARPIGLPVRSNVRLYPCPDCGNGLSKSASRCPQCGRKISGWDRYKRLGFFGKIIMTIMYPIMLVLVLIIMLSVLGTCAGIVTKL